MYNLCVLRVENEELVSIFARVSIILKSLYPTLSMPAFVVGSTIFCHWNHCVAAVFLSYPPAPHLFFAGIIHVSKQITIFLGNRSYESRSHHIKHFSPAAEHIHSSYLYIPYSCNYFCRQALTFFSTINEANIKYLKIVNISSASSCQSCPKPLPNFEFRFVRCVRTTAGEIASLTGIKMHLKLFEFYKKRTYYIRWLPEQ